MRKTTLGKVKDNAQFKLSLRSKTWYTKDKKLKGRTIVVITSNSSGRSYEKPLATVCYEAKRG